MGGGGENWRLRGQGYRPNVPYPTLQCLGSTGPEKKASLDGIIQPVTSPLLDRVGGSTANLYSLPDVLYFPYSCLSTGIFL